MQSWVKDAGDAGGRSVYVRHIHHRNPLGSGWHRGPRSTRLSFLRGHPLISIISKAGFFGSPKDAEAAAQRHIGERQGGTERVAPGRPSTAARNLTAPALAMDAKAISMSHIFKQHRRQVALHRGWQHDDDILPRHAWALAYLEGGCDRGPRRDAAQYSLIARKRSGGVEGCVA